MPAFLSRLELVTEKLKDQLDAHGRCQHAGRRGLKYEVHLWESCSYSGDPRLGLCRSHLEVRPISSRWFFVGIERGKNSCGLSFRDSVLQSVDELRLIQ